MINFKMKNMLLKIIPLKLWPNFCIRKLILRSFLSPSDWLWFVSPYDTRSRTSMIILFSVGRHIVISLHIVSNEGCISILRSRFSFQISFITCQLASTLDIIKMILLSVKSIILGWQGSLATQLAFCNCKSLFVAQAKGNLFLSLQLLL